MHLIFAVLFIIICIGGVFCLAEFDKRVNLPQVPKEKLDEIPTPDPSGICHNCALQPWCSPRMQCWEAYREAAREILNI